MVVVLSKPVADIEGSGTQGPPVGSHGIRGPNGHAYEVDSSSAPGAPRPARGVDMLMYKLEDFVMAPKSECVGNMVPCAISMEE